MDAAFRIEFTRHGNDIHLRPSGNFTDVSAWELSNLLDASYTGGERIMIDTRAIGDVCPVGIDLFRCRFGLGRIPPDRIAFTGEKRREIAPEGCRLTAFSEKAHQCRCNGRCKRCACAEKGHERIH